MYKHPNVGKEKCSKEVANGFNLLKKNKLHIKIKHDLCWQGKVQQRSIFEDYVVERDAVVVVVIADEAAVATKDVGTVVEFS